MSTFADDLDLDQDNRTSSISLYIRVDDSCVFDPAVISADRF